MKRLTALIVTLVMAVSLAGCNISEKIGHGDTVLATAGDAKIYMRDMMYVLGTYKVNYEQMLLQFGYAPEDLTEYWQNEVEEGVTMEQDLIQTSFDQAKEDAALLLLAQRNGITYDKDQINTLKSQLKDAVAAMGTKEKIGERVFFETYLVTVDEYLAGEKNISAINVYKNSIRDSVELDENEIKEYYDENVDNIREITVQHVLVKYNDNESIYDDDGEIIEPTEEERAAAKEKAEDILAQAQAGADFGELVVEYSDDEASIEDKGEYVIDARSQMVEEFMDWSFEAGEGDMGIIETVYGFHVMKFISTSSYEDLIETIESTLKTGRMNLLIQQYIGELDLEWEVDEELFATVKITG